MLSSILRQKSFTSTSVHTLTAANNCLLNQTPLLIFLDNNLPDGKGIDFISDLRKKLPGSKIVMITAYDTPNDKKLALENGADEFIGKPFNRQTIISVVDKLLSA